VSEQGSDISPLYMLLTKCRAAALRVNMLKDNIKVNIKVIAPMITGIECDFINKYYQYRYFQSRFM
jgi:hypothetical protein